MAKLGKTIKNVIRGDTRSINLTFLDTDGTTPIDLSGGTVYFTVNSSSDPTDDTSKAIQKTESSSFTNATAGQHTITLTHSDTNIDPGTYWYDAQFVDSTGAYMSSYRGEFIIQSDITRS